MGTLSDPIITPVGRFVGGSITELRAVDFENKPKPLDKQQYEFSVAILKSDPGVNDMLTAIHQHAMSEFSNDANVLANIQTFNFGNRSFSWKLGDGDAPDRKGNVNKNTIGCWVIYLKTSFPQSCVDNTNAPIPAESVPRGCYVQVALTVQGNGLSADRAGIYINPGLVKMVAHGDPIQGGMDADKVFANTPVPAQLPPGASLTPVASAMPAAGVVPGAVPAAVAPTGHPAGLPTPAASPTAAPGNPGVPPIPGFSQGQA